MNEKMYMNPETGSVDTLENWKLDKSMYDKDDYQEYVAYLEEKGEKAPSYQDWVKLQIDRLVEVEEKDGQWVEV